MKTLHKISLLTMSVTFLLFATNTFATQIAVDTTCTAANVTLDTVRDVTSYIDPDSLNLLSTTYNASACVGMFLKDYTVKVKDGDDYANNNGNDDSWIIPAGNNIGEAGDGLLNGGGPIYLAPPVTTVDGTSVYTKYFDGDEFVDPSQFQDLDGDTHFTDPGWIHLANLQGPDDGASATIDYSKSGPSSLSDDKLYLGDLLDINIEFKYDGVWYDWLGTNTDITSGRWTLTTKDGAIAQARALLGPNSFDHLAISIKAANGFAIYDFDFTKIFASEDDPLLNFGTLYELSGTFNMNDFGGSGVSHMNFLARDPVDSPPNNVVPEPSTLILLGAGLAGLGIYSLRRK
jgi:hypothetical protein